MFEKNLIGSDFEVCLRTLLFLSCSPKHKWDETEIATCDYISMYAKDFRLGDTNLHGFHQYRQSEFSFREIQTKKSIKILVLYGLVDMHFTDTGYRYSISEIGLSSIGKIKGSYATQYLAFARKAAKLSDKTIAKIHIEISTVPLETEERDDE